MPIEQRLEERAGVGRGIGCDLLGRPLGDDQAAPRSTFGPHVDQPVGGLDHIQVVLDHHHRVARVDQPSEDTQQLADVLEVQSRGLVEDVQRAPGGPLLQLTGQLDALRLAAGQGRCRLPEAYVPEPTSTSVRRCRAIAGSGAKNSSPSSIDMSKTSAMDLPL